MRCSIILIYAGLMVLSLMVINANASENLERGGYWGAIDLGAGYVQQSRDEFEYKETNFFLGFQGGYTLINDEQS